MPTSNNKIAPELFIEPTEKFTRHLNLQDNERVIFSGMYGTGKTTFLKHYFTKNKDKYNVIHLYPVNYSVLTEEDIMKYIKFDILFNLFVERDDVEAGFTISHSDLYENFETFTYQNYLQILAALILFVPKMGWRLHNCAKQLLGWKEQFEKYQAERKKNDYDEIIDFAEKFAPKVDLYENDDITDLIIKILDNEKEKNKETKQNILIIDDLDRIDPHHIFRLFNIFAAHFDNRDELPNKFGFDKIIFVCDIKNIKAIFQNNYGTSTDFNGYIDKFFSKRVFYFGNVNAVQDFIKRVIEQLSFSEKTSINIESTWFKNQHLKAHLAEIIYFMLSANLLNLRSLSRYYKANISLPIKNLKLGKYPQSIKNSQIEALIIIDIIHNIIGDYENLIDIVEILSNLEYDAIDDQHNIELLIGSLLIILDERKISYSRGGSEPSVREHTIEGEKKIEYNFISRSEAFYATIHSFRDFTHSPAIEVKLTWNNYFNLLLKTLKYLKRKGY